MQSDFREIPVENILRQAVTTNPHFCNVSYIIYANPYAPFDIRVNTYFQPEGDRLRLCRYYDRYLCDTMEEYAVLPIERVEEQAYGAWMDGAH